MAVLVFLNSRLEWFKMACPGFKKSDKKYAAVNINLGTPRAGYSAQLFALLMT